MNKKFDHAIADLIKGAENFASYDDSEYYDENSGSFSVARNARGIIRSAGKPVVVVRSHQNPSGRLDKAQFDINITRLTANIPNPLQVAIFGSTHLQSGYSQFIVNPTGVTNTVVGGLNTPTAGTLDRVRFTFTDLVPASDIIDITCNQVPYPVFLKALENDLFRISNIRYRLANSANTIQFSQAHKFQSKSLFGKGAENDVTIGAYLKPEQFQSGVIDIPIAAEVDKETMFLMNVANTAVGYPFTTTLSVFVEAFDKRDKMKLS